jgi:hypothetical protein
MSGRLFGQVSPFPLMVSRFRELCDELNKALTPALRSAGYTGPHDAFSHQAVRYEFKRAGPSGKETIAVLFNRDRTPQFSIQLYVEPPAGLDKLEASGGDLIVGALSPCQSSWPFAIRAFGQQPSLLSRLLGQSSRSASQAVQSALVLLPEIERWWREQRSTKYVISSKVRYPGQNLRDA